MMFAIVFGLSMDYEVFLVSRIQERWLASRDNSRVRRRGPGRDSTGHHRRRRHHGLRLRVVRHQRPAAVLNVFGLGLAFAVFIDATVVRMVLVPSVMQLLGDANWWMPGFLRRALSEVHVVEQGPGTLA